MKKFLTILLLLFTLQLMGQSEEIYHAGIMHAEQGDFEAARDSFIRYVEIEPLDEAGWYNLAYFHYVLGDLNQAQINFTRAIENSDGYYEAYLSLLRDGLGLPVYFERIGSGGSYASKYGFMGSAVVDIYLVKYKNSGGEEKEVNLYISMYDYEEPLIPTGFQAASSR